MKKFFCLTAFSLLAVPLPAQRTQAGDWDSVATILGRKGAQQPDGVMKISFPRGDLTEVVRGVQLKPAFATSWIALKKMPRGEMVMAMGDLVVTDSEIAPVMQKLQAGSIEQSALHNHLPEGTPRLMFIHFRARGNAARIARAFRDAIALTATPLNPPAPSQASGFDLDTAALASALGYAGKIGGGAYQVSVPRRGKILENGMLIPPAMGVATVINFQPMGNGRAVIAGDFVMTGGEVNRVIRALQKNGIEVTSLHSHLLSESPRLLFMHYWGNDDAIKLARGLRAALAETNSIPPK